jgi:hypothetical protein
MHIMLVSNLSCCLLCSNSLTVHAKKRNRMSEAGGDPSVRPHHTPPSYGIQAQSTSLMFYNGNNYSYSWQDHYQKWCSEHAFLSMLPCDAKERKAAEHVTTLQTQVNDHFAKAQPEDKPLPYTDELFKEAAIEWLIQTDQVSFCFAIQNYCPLPCPNLSILAHPSI